MTLKKAIACGWLMAFCGVFAAGPKPENVPPLLTTEKGEAVETRARWETVRAPELLETFAKEAYGRWPARNRFTVRFSPAEPEARILGGKVLRKRVKITCTAERGTHAFAATAFIPRSDRPVPAFLLICNRDPGENIDPSRVRKSDFWPAESIVERGYAAITFWNGDIAPDWNTGCRQGVFACFEPPAGRRPNDAWGTLAAWAWGASRVMDWIETVPEINSGRVAVVGHSRGGKTALVAGVYDRRFAMVCSNDSGCSGAKLNHIMLPRSESVAVIMRNFPYWFCPNYTMVVNREKEWGVDQHCFLALLAPRLLCVASATGDLWAGPEGQYHAARLASPAWELYGKKGLVASGFPAPEKPLQEGCVSYHLRTGKHNLTAYDWHRYMDFADRHGWRK
jgi:hypothetical protein